MDLSEHFATFLEQLAGQSPRNRELYDLRLRDFLKLHGHKQPGDITRSDINQWIELLKNRGYAEATLSGYRQALKSFFLYLVEEEEISKSPADHIKRGSFISKRQKLPHEPDVQAVTAVARQWTYSNKPLRVRDAAIWLLSLQSGARAGEIRELKLSAARQALIGPDAFGVYMATSTGKTKEARLRFGQDAASALRRWTIVRPWSKLDRCFISVKRSKTRLDPTPRYRPLTKDSMASIWIRICKAAGVNRVIRSHALRHRLGDMAYREYGRIAAMLLNHKDWNTAMTATAFYHHPDEEDVSRASADLATNEEINAMRNLFGLDNELG